MSRDVLVDGSGIRTIRRLGEMRKFYKLFGVIALVTVEMFFYFRSGQDDLEMFFMIWIFISAALILNNTFRRGDRPAMLGLGGNDSVKYAYLSSTFMESELSSGKKNKPSRLGGLFDLWNLIYLCFLMVNIIGYIAVMPK